MRFNKAMTTNHASNVLNGHMSMCMCQQPLLRTLDEIVV